MVALMGRSREQNQVAAVALQHFGQLVVLGLRDLAAAPVSGQMMGLVEHDQIPGGASCNRFMRGRIFKRVDAGDQPVVLGECVRFPVSHVAFAAEDLEVEVEDFVEFPVPVVDQPGRDHHQHPIQFTPAGKFPQDQRVSMVLPRPTSSAIEKAPGRRRGDPVRQHDLVGQEVDLGRGQGGGTLQQRQGMGLVGQPCPFRPSFARLDVVDDLFGAVDGGRQRAQWHLALTNAEEDPDESIARRRYDDPFTDIPGVEPVAQAGKDASTRNS